MPHLGEFLGLMFGVQPNGANQAVVPGLSPFTYTAPRDGRVIVSGGTVTTIEIGRGGAFVVVGLVAGIVPVTANDRVRVTYVVAPTMTFMPT